MYIVLNGKIDIRRNLPSRNGFRELQVSIIPKSKLHTQKNITAGHNGDLVQEKIFQMVDRGRPLIGFESHNVFETEGSPFTYITSSF